MVLSRAFNKCADQSSNLPGLISDFVFHCLDYVTYAIMSQEGICCLQLTSAFVFATYEDSTIFLLPKSEISIAVQPGLYRAWSEPPKTGFLVTRPV